MKCSLRPLPLLLLATLLSCPLTAAADTYRILLSNDDGFDTPELGQLGEALEQLPDTEVFVSAPASNQSGSSQSLSGSELTVEKVYRAGELRAYTVDGTPADAVRFAILTEGRERPFDLVVSGINQGANVGNVAHLSGTVGAAMEAQYHGIPSIAVSQEVRGVDTGESARFAARIVDRLRREGAPTGIVLSINIPAGDIRGVRVRPMADSYLQTTGYETVSEQGDSMVVRRQRGRVQSSDSGSDTFAYQGGYITITPLRFDWTAHEWIDELRSWNLE